MCSSFIAFFVGYTGFVVKEDENIRESSLRRRIILDIDTYSKVSFNEKLV